MSEIGAGPAGRFDVARVVSRVFRVLGANPAVFVGLAVLLELPDLALNYGVVFLTKQALATGNYATAVLLIGAVRTFVSFLCRNLLTAALIHGTITTLNGNRASFGQCLLTGLRNLVPLLGLTLLSALGEGAGFLLLVVPGVILALMWFVITPVYVVEHPPVMSAFERSSALTRDCRGQIFAIALLFGIISWGLFFLTNRLTMVALGMVPSFALMDVSFALSSVVRVAMALLAAVGVASVYYELRIVKEGAGSEQLAEVFA